MSESWTPDAIEHLPWYRELEHFLQAELVRADESRSRQRPALEREIEDIKSHRHGWALSLGNPKLNPDARTLIEEQMGTAGVRLRELEDILSAMDATSDSTRAIADPKAIADRLARLRDILGCENASRINIELARHIDAIRCYSDGKVVVRTCKLGALALEEQASEFFADTDAKPLEADGMSRGRPRKRSVRSLQSEDAGPGLRQEAHWAADVNRFAGLDDDWFWEDEYHVPESTFWSKENALEVARMKIEGDHMTNDRLAEFFGISLPTVRNALRHAVEQDPSLKPLLGKIARTRWEDLHYHEVYAEKTTSGTSMKGLCDRFEKSEPTIRKALELAAKKGLGNSDLEETAESTD